MELNEHTRDWLRQQTEYWATQLRTAETKRVRALDRVRTNQEEADKYKEMMDKYDSMLSDIERMLTDWEV